MGWVYRGAVIRQARLKAVVRALLIGCMVLVVGCSSRVRSEALKEEPQGHSQATKKQQESAEATREEGRSFDVLKKQGIVGGIFDTSVQPGDPEARYITNDVPGCPNGGLLSGTDKPDRLAGEEGEDEVRGLGAADRLSGGHGPDVIYGGPGDDALHGGIQLEFEPFTDSSKNVLYGESGRDELIGETGDDVLYGGPGDDKWLRGAGGEDVLYGGDGRDFLDGALDVRGEGVKDTQRDRLYCGKGKDQYDADKNDYVSSTCEVKGCP
jgi:Ca2+-binding RTX toxin-like protein